MFADVPGGNYINFPQVYRTNKDWYSLVRCYKGMNYLSILRLADTIVCGTCPGSVVIALPSLHI